MRVYVAASTVLASLLITAAPLVAAPSGSSTIVISEFRTRGPNGANDEFIELYNKSNASVDISGWKIKRSSAAGAISDVIQIPGGTSVPAGDFYLLTNTNSQGYSGQVVSDLKYTLGVEDAGGIAVVDASNNIIDQVGMGALSSYGEGTPLPALTQNINQSYERNNGGCIPSQDTNTNTADFRYNGSSSYPQNSATNCQGGCSEVVCLSPPDNQCWSAQGSCSNGTCSYPPLSNTTGCNDDNVCTKNDTCDGAGTCVPGTAMVCNSPPPNYCFDSDTLVTYSSTGSCDPVTGCTNAYTQTSTTCAFGCDGANAICNPDPCLGKSCPLPNDCYESAACVSGQCVYTVKALGSTCDDGDQCTVGDTCNNGTCVSGTAKTIDDQNLCTTDACDTTTGTVTHEIVVDGTSCEDGNLCNGAETCHSGTCTNGTAKTCTTPPTGGCYKATGTCAPSTGICSYQPLDQGTTCDDGSLCTTADQCDGNGTCVGSTKLCPEFRECTDQSTSLLSWSGSCNETTGNCVYTQTSNSCSTGCNTNTGNCNDILCEGVVCTTPPDNCHASTGTCSAGICSYALKSPGASCDDGNACTSVDQCSAGGACQGTPLNCNTPPAADTCISNTTSRSYSASGTCTAGSCNYTYTDTTCAHGCNSATGLCADDPCAGITCDQPPSSCHQNLGTCTNGTCTYARKGAESSCDDGNVCTQNDLCTDQGTCWGSPVICNDPPASVCVGGVSQAYEATGTCNSLGDCTYTRVDTTCTTGCNTQSGLCNEDPCSTVTCNTPPGPCSADQGTCHQGVCTYAPKPATVTCNDGNACTSNDTCDGSGNCKGVAIGGCGTGGTTSTGGATSTGGTSTVESSSTGGVLGSGGVTAATGGVIATGGVVALGGTTSTTTTVIAATGGVLAVGGTTSTNSTVIAATGGVLAVGGTSSSGGSSTTVASSVGGLTSTGGASTAVAGSSSVPGGASSVGGTTALASSAGNTSAGKSSVGGASAAAAGASQVAGNTALAGATATGTSTDMTGADSVDSGGCNCSVPRQSKGAAWGLALLAVVLLRRRRKA